MKQTYKQLESQLSAAREQIEQMAAESAGIRERHHFIRALAVSILEHSGGRMDWRAAMEDATDLIRAVDGVYTETPATDAAIAEIRATGLDEMAGVYRGWANKEDCSHNMQCSYRLTAERAEGYAAYIRQQLRAEASNG